MADATFVAAANSGTDTQTTSKSVNKPASVASGDIGVFQLTRWNDTNSFPTVTLPSGAVGRTPQVQGGTGSFQETIIFADYVGGESSWAVSWTGSRWSSLKALFFRDVDPALNLSTVPFDIDIGTGAPVNLTVDAAIGDALAYFMNTNSYSGSTTHTPPTGFTEPASFDNDPSSGAYKIATAGGTQTVAGSNSPSQDHIHALMALAHSSSGGSVDLVIQDAAHAHTADNVAFTQVHGLAIQDSAHSHIVDNLAITQNHVMTVQDALHGHTAEQSNFVYNIQLAIQKATHAVSSDVVDYTQVHQIAIHNALHETLADNLSLDGSVTLIIQGANHAHSADGLVLVQNHILQIQDAHHVTRADVVQLVDPGFGGFMTVSDVQLQKMAAATGLTGSVSDLERAYYGALSGLAPVHQFSIADHKRVYWETQTGLSNRSLADLEKAFYDAQLIAAGSLSDREFTYWTNL